MRLFTLVLSVLTLISTQALAATFGMPATEGPNRYFEKATVHGADDHATVYWTLGSNERLPVERVEYVDQDVILVVKFPKIEGSILKAVRNGQFGYQTIDLGNRIMAAGKKVTVRVFYEGNGNWYRHHAYHSSNSPDDFVPAVRQFVTLLRRFTGDLVTIDFNLNRRSAGKFGTDDFERLYAGDEYIDIISISSYNRCGIRKGQDDPRSFADDFVPAYNAIREFTDQPIAVAETGTSGFCGVDKIVWFHDLLQTIKEYPVDNVTFFFENVEKGAASNDRPIYWGVDKGDVNLFKRMLEDFRMNPEAFPTIDLGFTYRKGSVTRTGPVSPVQGSKPEIKSGSNFAPDSAPWIVYGSVGYVFEEDNTGISPITGDIFGDTGAIVKATARQSLFWEPQQDLRFGPFAYISVNDSSNNDRWWDNNVSIGGGVRVEIDSPVGDWGNFGVQGRVEERFYTVDTPSRISNDRETRFVVEGTFTFGGDHLK